MYVDDTCICVNASLHLVIAGYSEQDQAHEGPQPSPLHHRLHGHVCGGE